MANSFRQTDRKTKKSKIEPKNVGSFYGTATPFKSANRINVLTREYHFQNGLIKHHRITQKPKNKKKWQTYKKIIRNKNIWSKRIAANSTNADVLFFLCGSCKKGIEIGNWNWNSYSFDFTMLRKWNQAYQAEGSWRQLKATQRQVNGASTKCSLPKTDTHLFYWGEKEKVELELENEPKNFDKNALDKFWQFENLCANYHRPKKGETTTATTTKTAAAIVLVFGCLIELINLVANEVAAASGCSGPVTKLPVTIYHWPATKTVALHFQVQRNCNARGIHQKNI